jgi:hypothetical protein
VRLAEKSVPVDEHVAVGGDEGVAVGEESAAESEDIGDEGVGADESEEVDADESEEVDADESEDVDVAADVPT